MFFIIKSFKYFFKFFKNWILFKNSGSPVVKAQIIGALSPKSNTNALTFDKF